MGCGILSLMIMFKVILSFDSLCNPIRPTPTITAHYAENTCEIILFQNYFSLSRRPSEIVLFHRVETCPKLSQNYFTGLLQLMHISNMSIAAEIIVK